MSVESISIIVVSHRDDAFLATCQASIQSASLHPVESIVSPVAAPIRIASDAPSSATRAAAINSGVRQTNGSIVGWLSSDDILQPRALDSVAHYFATHREVDVVYGPSQYIDGDGNLICPLDVPTWNRTRLERRCFLQFPAVFYRRRLFDPGENLDSSLEYWEDYQWCLRLSQQGARFARLDETLAAKRVHAKNRIIGTRDPMHLERSSREVVSLLQRQLHRIPARWAIHCGQTAAEIAGHAPEQSAAYDRVLLDTAMSVATPPEGWVRRHDQWMANALIVMRHVASESKAISRRPRLATRFLSRVPQQMYRHFWDRKIFRLHNYEPRDTWQLPRIQPTNDTNLELPTISIVTPNLNQGKYLGRTIRSVADQSYPHLEYVIEDGASTDNSVQVIEEFASHITHWESAPDSGQADAINRGMRKTTGQIMAYLNSDDLLLPGSLSYVARYFATHPKVDVVYGHRLLIDEHDREIGRWISPPHDDKLIAWADYIPQETLFWRRRALGCDRRQD